MGAPESTVIIVLLYSLFLLCVFFTTILPILHRNRPKFNIDKNHWYRIKMAFLDWVPFSSHSGDSELRLFALKCYIGFIGEKSQSLLNVPHHAMRVRRSLTSSEPAFPGGFSKGQNSALACVAQWLKCQPRYANQPAWLDS